MAGGMRKRGPQRGTKKDLNRRRESKKGSNGCNDGRKIAATLGIFAVLMIFLARMTNITRTNTPETFEAVLDLSATIVECDSSSYEPRVPGCSPSYCFRESVPNFATESEVECLLQLAEEGISIGGGGSGPVSVFDTASGASSKGKEFISAFQVLKATGRSLNKTRTAVFQSVVDRVGTYIRKKMGLTNLYPASPTFFSRIEGGVEPGQLNDQYWHKHVDTRQYGSFIYTTLLYLNTNHKHYKGGEFLFMDGSGTLLRPQAGMLLVFTSGEENPHKISKVTEGTRYAVTISWTCDERQANRRRFAAPR
ncbi:hypothetical protein AAMO2058_000464500 [Amorphochlora amoebiformis]|uniref:Fe2OG dioxygenase domain-containing protein n=1 Tax=Amorphochlora amoebiformis TaxID=1561963 RepID=A0A7S0D7U3_9EUKA|mmetsp:Transcript_198/g.253  ORF Transcript_198/g.253 Transcript_198/m.253 type:complete len:308 (+) Transcript_198:14-937(+)